MAKPILAIVGRPNVGKSSLFNYLGRARVSIVEDTPGVTRDRIYMDTEWSGREFTMVDTGGIEFDIADVLLQQMRAQAMLAINEADAILFMVDAKAGMTADDAEVAAMLRHSRKPVVLAVNKIDSKKQENDVYEFYNLGLGEPIPISTTNARNLGDLLDAVIAVLPKNTGDEDLEDDVIRVAFVGRPNVGKSSFVRRRPGYCQ